MLHIAICDDEQEFADHLRQLLERYSRETGGQIKTTIFYDGKDLVEGYDPSMDLIFLDIKMNRMNGLKTAERIRQRDSRVGIIFLTSLAQYGLEGYRYQAANYIIKPLKYARLKLELDRWTEQHRQEEGPFLVVENNTGKYKIFLKTLCYVETFNRNLMFHTEQENIICYKSMKEMEKTLCGDEFVRCHTSYIVNLFFVKGVKKMEVELITGEMLPISQPRRKEFMEKLTEYWGNAL